MLLLLWTIVAGAASAGDPPRKAQSSRWRVAFREALHDRDTWIPVLAAATITLSGTDDAIAGWASRRTPLFGSQNGAARSSDTLRTAAHLGMVATALMPRTGGSAWQERGQRMLFQHAFATTSTSSARLIKELSGRRRPDGSDELGFPSGHSTRAFAYSALASQNLEDADLPAGVKRGMRFSFRVLAAGTAWARLEAGVHYPSDVLVGAGLGNFVACFVNRAFLDTRPNMSVGLSLDRDAPQVWLQWKF